LTASSPEHLDLFAVTAPGLEPLAEAELRALGIDAAAEPGGVAWSGAPETLYAANLRLRTASRVLVRLAEFRARTFYELERHARRIDWARIVPAGAAVRLRVTSRKSRLYHQNAVAERILAAIEGAVGGVAAAPAGPAAAEEDEDAGDAQLLVVRLLRDQCTVSADTSGAPLHRRGYRQAVAKAPLRETLAAAMLLAGRWSGDEPLLDPLCGAGTIPIEAALLARRIAPGLARPGLEPRAYAFQRWPGFDEAIWRRVVEAAAREARPAAGVPIVASDRDAGAIEAARANAERAGVLGDLRLDVRPLSAAEAPEGRGALVTNPPYGVRVGERAGLRDLYAALGRLARTRLPGWRIVMLSADRALEAQVGVPFTEVLRTRNGGIPVRMVVGEVG
jgi:putative N6-adenine-specific DNA methylase